MNIEHSTFNAQHRKRPGSTRLALGAAGACREQFADGSAVVTCPDGSQLILESALAKSTVFREGRPVNYSEPPRGVATRKK